MGYTQLGSLWSKQIFLTDVAATGSQLFLGSAVTCFAKDMTFSGNIRSGAAIKINAPSPDYVSGNIGSQYNSLINYNSFSGVENSNITLSGTWTVDLGSYGTAGEPILTPYKVFLMASSGHTFYLKDERIVEQMIIESGSQLFGTNGIPVVITGYDITTNMSTINSIDWSLTLQEDLV